MLTSSLLTLAKTALSRNVLTIVRNSSYKSSISLDKLYPKSNLDLTGKFSNEKLTSNKDEFSGYIPIEKLQIKHNTCSKPGGQHVNKTQTGVEIRFHVDTSEWIPKWIREKIKEKHVNRLTKDGYFVVKSEKTRKALLNQADCLERIRSVIFEASQKPRGLSEEEKNKIEIDKKIADGKRLLEKRKQSENKSQRRRAFYDATYDYYGREKVF